MSDSVYLNDLGIVNALGCGQAEVRRNMLAGKAPGMRLQAAPVSGRTFFTGQVLAGLPSVPAEFAAYASHNTQLLLETLEQIKPTVLAALQRYTPDRIAVVMGSSTGGVAETEQAVRFHSQNGHLPEQFDYRQHEVGSSAEFVARYFGLTGPAYGISTACSSSGKVLASARSLLQQGYCDVVIAGGADSLCELTLQGFKSLEAVSDELCNPFSINRKGINIGEAAAVFVVSRERAGVRLCGVGESSDAWHMSAPEPGGDGAMRAMQAALADAGLEPAVIDYLNLHGTGTRLNDSMESHAVQRVLGSNCCASSSKPLTGHTLGAAGATEAGLCWLLLTSGNDREVIPHLYDGQFDPAFSKIRLCETALAASPVNTVMSNSFAFGGSNVSIILGRLHDA